MLIRFQSCIKQRIQQQVAASMYFTALNALLNCIRRSTKINPFTKKLVNEGFYPLSIMLWFVFVCFKCRCVLLVCFIGVFYWCVLLVCFNAIVCSIMCVYMCLYCGFIRCVQQLEKGTALPQRQFLLTVCPKLDSIVPSLFSVAVLPIARSPFCCW